MNNSRNLRVSIAIPTFNQGEFLENTILCALNQTVKPYEVVVSNNHSTDELTHKILKKYENRIKVVTPPKFLSMVENFKFLANNVSGDWVGFICSDDFYSKDFIDSFYTGLDNVSDNFNEIVVVRFGFNSVDINGLVTKANFIRTSRKIESFPFNFYEQLTGSKGSICASLFRSDILKKINDFDLNLNLCFDWGLFLNFSKYGSFLYIPKICSNIRLDYRKGLSLKRLGDNILDFIYIYDELQRKIIFDHRLSFFWHKLAIKLRYFEVESFYKSQGLVYDEFLVKLSVLLQGNKIRNKFEYLILKLIMRTLQVLYMG